MPIATRPATINVKIQKTRRTDEKIDIKPQMIADPKRAINVVLPKVDNG